MLPPESNMRRLLLTLPLLLVLPAQAQAELAILSAGAVEPGLEAAVTSFRQLSGNAAQITYATAPQLRERLLAGEAPDLLIAPVALINELVTTGRLGGDRATLGRVGIGVAVRPGAPVPDISDAAALKRAVEQAETVVFNRASTGQYLERLFERWGITAAVAAKAKRYATGAEVMQHLLAGNGREIGFAPITEIRQTAVHFVGPLPAEVQNYTAYAASLLPGSQPAAAELLRHLAGPVGRAAFEATGVEAMP